MALSPNYGWSEPDNSSLVKNGAADIRTLGDAIDTSLWNVGFGQAGKNKMINGDFGIWQRGTSFSNPANGAYTADRYIILYNGTGSTRTYSQQAFTAGTAPVAGYEGQYFWRLNQSVAGSGGTFNVMAQYIEDVRTFAGQPVTFSFWAKADAARTLNANIIQNFGSGGSGEVVTAVTLTSSGVLTTSWQRYTGTITVPSVTGKTIGTSSFLKVEVGFPLNTAMTIDLWGMQLEYGSKATPFKTATGTIQGELAACQRYYWQSEATAQYFWSGQTNNTTNYYIGCKLPTTMRVAPTITLTSQDFSGFPSTAGSVIRITTNNFIENRAATATQNGGYFGSSVVASAEL
jgi:hypothetical protein